VEQLHIFLYKLIPWIPLVLFYALIIRKRNQVRPVLPQDPEKRKQLKRDSGIRVCLLFLYCFIGIGMRYLTLTPNAKSILAIAWLLGLYGLTAYLRRHPLIPPSENKRLTP